MAKNNSESYKFEIKMKNGKSKSANSGHDIWQFAVQNDKNLETKFDERHGPFLCDFFEKRWQNSKKQSK